MELMSHLYGNMERGRGFDSRTEDTFYFHNLLTLDGSKMIMRRVWVLASFALYWQGALLGQAGDDGEVEEESYAAE
ncbi:hypothetical protein RvY_04181 [Ramazzottius varieornatus]|uniref:Uncharacterized protein n=1 Tax=Ramazzottius varieornatus TaxID=947166 RepID=A0A1D1UWD3_RAMVA|nr:hypothetical protein RvY_04181 [Ramazzottius varieornatus]